MQETIIINGISIEITKKKIKNIHLKILPPDGKVAVSMPYSTSLSAVKKFILAKWSWIEKHQKQRQQKPTTPRYEYLNDEMHYVWGIAYPLRLVTDYHPQRVYIQENQLHLHAPANATPNIKLFILDQWYHEQLRTVIPQYIEKWQPQLNVKVTEFGLRKMKSCWGSCNPRTGNIVFNTELAKKTLDCLEYIVVHEMVHLLEPSHNHRFKGFMDQFLPDWRLRKEFLNR